MRRRSNSIASLAALLVFVGIACSDPVGSTVDRNPGAVAGARSSAGGAPNATASAGAAGRATTAGAASNSAGPGNTVIPGEACNGLPIDLSADAQAGADASGAQAGAAADVACNGVSVEAEAVPVDVFIIMDRSQSMSLAVKGSSKTRWEALHDAVRSFTESAGAADIRAGIGFFSLSGSGDDARDCSPEAYATPSVPIGLISAVGSELVAAMNDVAPGGLTPTVPALQGAISYARSWAQKNPGRATMVVLVTDGFPTQCDNEPDQISQAAQSGYESLEHIRTFVIGVGDVAKFNLDNFARSGGTKKAYLTDAGDVTTTFVDALNNITNRALACEYQLPPPPDGMRLDSTKVQVVYSPSSGEPEEVPSISSFAACAKNSNGGWYYDDPDRPSKITVCPCTCARLQAGRVDVRLGCKPRLGLR
ncbi:MAG TPA: vWA domain-containing protein [Polyangiaceae bacterium]|nr:vWA domain-containing protein [Polyangiaceae bacterium]